MDEILKRDNFSIKRTLRRWDIKMVVYNLYLVLNDEPIEIYDKITRMVVYEGSSNDIPEKYIDRSVHYLTVVKDKEGRYLRTIIVID